MYTGCPGYIHEENIVLDVIHEVHVYVCLISVKDWERITLKKKHSRCHLQVSALLATFHY